MVQQNCQQETANSENPLSGGNLLWGVKISVEKFKASRAEPTDDAEAWRDFWLLHGDFIYRNHIELRVQLYVPKEETFIFH